MTSPPVAKPTVLELTLPSLSTMALDIASIALIVATPWVWMRSRMIIFSWLGEVANLLDVDCLFLIRKIFLDKVGRWDITMWLTETLLVDIGIM